MNLSEEISKLQSYQLFTGFEEIKRYEKTGILVDGIVRGLAEKFAEEMEQENFKFLRITCELFHAEMAQRYYNSMKI